MKPYSIWVAKNVLVRFVRYVTEYNIYNNLYSLFSYCLFYNTGNALEFTASNYMIITD